MIFKKYIIKIVILICCSLVALIINACSPKLVTDNEMDYKFLDLYNKIKEAHRIMEYGPNELLTDEMYYNYGSVKKIDFDLKGNIWVYRTPGDGCYTLDLYLVDGNKYSYSYVTTTSGGEEGSEWYEKYINDVEIFDDEYENISKEASKIFKKYDYLKFDKKRFVKLVLNNMKAIPDYGENINVDDYDSLELGRYEEKNIASTMVKPIEWCVLYNDGEKAFLVSKKILMREKMNDSLNKIRYKDTMLYKFLNKEFYNNSFNESEKSIIMDTEYGKLFLLSEYDINKYVNADKKKLITYATPIFDDMIQDGNRWILSEIKYSLYWLRDDNVDIETNESKYLDENGKIGYGTNTEIKGVRPAMWVKYK